jgi:hypothetical protein
MQHLDEHTIAFYAMGAEFSAAEKGIIEAHLRECHGCRAQVEELRGIDQHVAEAIDSSEQSDDLPSEALTTMPRAIRRRPDAYPAQRESRAVTRSARFGAIVRRHPVAAGSAGFALGLLAFFALTMLTGRIHQVDEPQIVRVNAMGTSLEVFGKDRKIFEIPVSAYGATKEDRDQFENLDTYIGDLDGDGKREVITGAPFREEGQEVWNVLRIFSPEGEEIHRWPLGHPVDYKGTAYSNAFGVSGVLVIGGGSSRQPELLVGINNERSPSCLLRLDNHGKTIGEYWHFGWLHGPRTIRLEEMPNGYVLMIGVNDAGYRANTTNPVVTVLDPEKVQGIAEATEAGGFGYPASNAEIYYVRAGNVDTTLVSNIRVVQPSFGHTVKFSPDSSFTVFEGFFVPRNFPAVTYTFTPRMLLRDIWFTDDQRIRLMNEYLTRKNAEGLMEFQNDLKSKVEYWDGGRWQKKPSRVFHRTPPT